MTLEFEKLTQRVEALARSARGRYQTRETRLAEVEGIMRQYATAWETIERQVQTAVAMTLDATPFRPYHAALPLNAGRGLATAAEYDPANLPSQATLIAVDGSQIVPDRHAPFVYNLINVGGLVYHHGQDVRPEPFTEPQLRYPDEIDLDDFHFLDSERVRTDRDLREIGILAEKACHYKREAVPLLAVMDQRLLYVPVGELGPGFKEQTIQQWQASINGIRQCGSWLAGYVDNPGKDSIIAMLRALYPNRRTDDPNNLEEWLGLTDADLFGRLLEPGQRSKIFVEVSYANRRFATHNSDNEICFFYLNPQRTGRGIARVDLPRWVAEDEAAVAAIHALVYDQCRILGSYPYVITRADEMAVVKRRDQEELEFRIGRMMDKYNLEAAESPKQQSKQWGRSDKQRHGI